MISAIYTNPWKGEDSSVLMRLPAICQILHWSFELYAGPGIRKTA